MPEAAVLDPIQKLHRDIKKAAIDLSENEVRYLVDYYYIAQEDRKRSFNQEKSLEKGDEPHDVISWLAKQSKSLEDTIKAALGVWAAGRPAGAWAQSICGIGPVISAGLLAHIDIDQAPTVGHIWSFAGLDPSRTWVGREKFENIAKNHDGDLNKILDTVAAESGISRAKLEGMVLNDNKKITLKNLKAKATKRPFNAQLKSLVAFKLGECFVKVQNNDKDIYGAVFAQKKAVEIERNDAGLFVGQAADKLKKYKIKKDTDAYAWYSGSLTPENAATLRLMENKKEGDARKLAGEPGSGLAMLPPAHIHARARRYVVKLFLAHFHEALWREKYGNADKLPMPYIFTDQAKKLGLGDHTHLFKFPDPEGIFA